MSKINSTFGAITGKFKTCIFGTFSCALCLILVRQKLQKKVLFYTNHMFPHDITTIKSANSTWKCSKDLALE